MLGKTGFVEAARQCLAKAHYLRGRILSLSGYSPAFRDAPFFNEFAVRVRGGSAARVCAELEKKNIIAGFDLGRLDAAQRDRLLIAVTETHSRADLDGFVSALDAV
jgi:glycine dehydrogenase subunit 1